jgi:hypothetical protein
MHCGTTHSLPRPRRARDRRLRGHLAATTTAQPAAAKASPAGGGAAKFSGDNQINYEDAKSVCGESAPGKLAHDLSVRVDVHSSKGLRRLAERYAADYGPTFRKAVVEGCLAGLPKP